MKITAVSSNNLTTPKLVTTPRFSPAYSKPGNDVFVKSNTISFGASMTFVEKRDPFLRKLYNYILNSEKFSLDSLGEIIQKYSPGLLVKSMQEIPPALADGAANHAARFSFGYNIEDMKEVVEGQKTIFLNIPSQDDIKNRLILMDNVSHEMMHVFQEESSDRISHRQFIQKVLDKDLPLDVKIDTLRSMSNIFNEAEIRMQQPLLRSLGKKDIIPRTVKSISPKILNEIYINQVNMPAEDFLARTFLASVDKAALKFPNLDRKTVFEHSHLTALNEREAYLNAGYIVKRALGINTPVDTEYRVLLYDLFAKVIGSL